MSTLSTRGGYRPGSGRKTKAETHETAITRAEGRICDRLPQLIDKLFALADGVTVQEKTPAGGTKTYTRPPDFKALAYLIDRVMGKPTIRQEVSGPQGAAISLEVDQAIAKIYGEDNPWDALEEAG